MESMITNNMICVWVEMGMSSTIIKHWQHDMPPGGKPVAQFSAAALEPEKT